jgi:hypothetical protein
VLVDGVLVHMTVTALLMMDETAAAPTAGSSCNFKADLWKLRVCGTQLPSRTLRWWILVSKQGTSTSAETPAL